MRVFKPLQLSLLPRAFSWQKKNRLAITCLLGFPFNQQQDVLLEPDLWKFLADELGKDAMLDMCMPKPNGEVLVYGSYFAPGGNAVTADRVQVVMGDVNKQLAVIGDRFWRAVVGPTPPEPFTNMPINYEHAFGGKEFKNNPSGKGMDEVDVYGEQRIPLPNIEDPDALVTSTGQRPNPAGFAPLDASWEQRASKMGTYDEKWQREDFPGYASDLDWTHFNAGASDQWIDGFWRGDEVFQILNMHADKPKVDGKLPAFRCRCFIDSVKGESTEFNEVDMRAETVFLFPHVETGVLLFRGTIDVEEDDATDVKHLLLAYEDLSQSIRPQEYYQQALINRLDDITSMRYMMTTRDIIADSERCGYARILDGVSLDAESELSKNIEARVEAEKEKMLQMIEEQKNSMREQLIAAGVDPQPYMDKFDFKEGHPSDDPHMKPILETIEKILPGSTSGNNASIDIEQSDFSKFGELEKKIEEMVAAKKDELRKQIQSANERFKGTDVEQEMSEKVEKALKQIDAPSPLPRPGVGLIENLQAQIKDAKASIEALRADGVAEDKLPRLDIDVDAKIINLQQGIDRLNDAYLVGAHHIVGSVPHAETMSDVQQQFLADIEQGRSLSGRDLAGINASGMDLSGLDFSGCYLEHADFSHANLNKTKFSRSVITHADFTNATFVSNDMQEANLGASRFQGARLENVSLKNGVLSKADLSGATFLKCNLEDVEFLEVKMKNVDMSGCVTNGANFIEIDFSGGVFVECEFIECNFLQCTIDHVNFSDANISGCNFVESKLDDSKFVNTTMINVRFPGGCSLLNCNFGNATMDKANFRDVDAQNSSFENSTFHMADFGGANLQKTRFYGSSGKRAMFMKTDLAQADFSSVNIMEGSMMSARLTSADLRDSNFYGVEFMNATVGDTDFTGANLDLTKLEHWQPSR